VVIRFNEAGDEEQIRRVGGRPRIERRANSWLLAPLLIRFEQSPIKLDDLSMSDL
jgi:hypothetical protein